MTHPHEAWLAALKPGGRLVVPLTFTVPQMGSIGKGAIALLARDATGEPFSARVIGMVAIYSAVGIRDEGLNARLLDAYKRGPWPSFTRLRRRRARRITSVLAAWRSLLPLRLIAQPPPGPPRVVLVTGASSGIGKACAEYLFARRCRVYGTSRRTPRVEVRPTPPEAVPLFQTIPLDITSDDVGGCTP